MSRPCTPLFIALALSCASCGHQPASPNLPSTRATPVRPSANVAPTTLTTSQTAPAPASNGALSPAAAPPLAAAEGLPVAAPGTAQRPAAHNADLSSDRSVKLAIPSAPAGITDSVQFRVYARTMAGEIDRASRNLRRDQESISDGCGDIRDMIDDRPLFKETVAATIEICHAGIKLCDETIGYSNATSSAMTSMTLTPDVLSSRAFVVQSVPGIMQAASKLKTRFLAQGGALKKLQPTEQKNDKAAVIAQLDQIDSLGEPIERDLGDLKTAVENLRSALASST